MNEVLQKIHETGIIPVVVLNDAKDAAPLAKALCEGGLPCAEVTFRTDAAEESIRIMTSEYPEGREILSGQKHPDYAGRRDPERGRAGHRAGTGNREVLSGGTGGRPEHD